MQNKRKDLERNLLPLAVLIFASTAAGTKIEAGNTDWGYSNDNSAAPPQKELKAGAAGALLPSHRAPAAHQTLPASKSPAKQAASKGTNNRPPAARHTSPAASASAPHGDGAQAVRDWLSLFTLVSKQQLSDEQKERLESTLKQKLNSPKSAEILSVLQFWPQASRALEKTPEQTENLAALFRALLRFQSRSKALSDDERAMLLEVLGPEKIAVAGDPPLTDEALDAYGDMACFMYEHEHPGKTVDATDNRAIFSSVICNKFRDAPSPADQKAMANFALTWARFKANWAAASAEQQEQLFSQLKGTSKPTKQNASALVDLIMHNGPWAG